MITNILDYIVSYDDVRAACGLNSEELKDAELALTLYLNNLNILMNSTSGSYPEGEDSETLEEIFARVDDDDIMHVYISSLAIYSTADAALGAVGLKAYKTMADGKSTLTRFSPESAYQDTVKAVKDKLSYYMGEIYDLLGEAVTVISPLVVATPAVDLVTGE